MAGTCPSGDRAAQRRPARHAYRLGWARARRGPAGPRRDASCGAPLFRAAAIRRVAERAPIRLGGRGRRVARSPDRSGHRVQTLGPERQLPQFHWDRLSCRQADEFRVRRPGQIAPKVPSHLLGSGDFCVVLSRMVILISSVTEHRVWCLGTEFGAVVGDTCRLVRTCQRRAISRDVPRHIPSRCRPGGSRNPSPVGAAGVPVPQGPRSS